MESLRALASGGRAIITTIHQPSSRLYQLLDKLMLLCDGHVMYYGKVSRIVASRYRVQGFCNGKGPVPILQRRPHAASAATWCIRVVSGLCFCWHPAWHGFICINRHPYGFDCRLHP